MLRDWLLERRAEALAQFGPFPPPEPEEPKRDQAGEARARRAARGAARGGRRARRAAARLPRPRAQAGLVGVLRPARADAGGAGRGRGVDRRCSRRPASPEQDKRSWRPPVRLPGAGAQAQGRPPPVRPRRGGHAGEIVELDRDARAARAQARPDARRTSTLPQALLPGRPYRTDAQEDALMRRRPLAARRRPPLPGGRVGARAASRSAATMQTTDLEEMAQLVLSLDGRHLVIQGPPGSGKTWVSGRLIARLLREGKRVGVASTSHKAIHKLLDEVEARRRSTSPGIKKATAGNPESFYESDHIRSEPDRQDCLDVRPHRRHLVLLRARRPRRHARLPVRRRGGAGLARRRARDGRPARGTSSSSATRSSSRR